MRDGLSRGLLETILVLSGTVVLLLDAAGVWSDGFLIGSFLVGAGGFSVANRVSAPKNPDPGKERP